MTKIALHMFRTALATVALAGCHEPVANLAGPDESGIQAARNGGGGGSAVVGITAVASGVLNGEDTDPKVRIGPATTTIDLHHMALSLGAEPLGGPDADMCFGAGGVEGTLAVYGGGKAEYYFTALARDGVTSIGYTLTVSAGSFDGPWPPEAGSTTTLTTSAWEVQAAKRKNQNPCSGAGDATTTIAISRAP